MTKERLIQRYEMLLNNNRPTETWEDEEGLHRKVNRLDLVMLNRQYKIKNPMKEFSLTSTEYGKLKKLFEATHTE